MKKVRRTLGIVFLTSLPILGYILGTLTMPERYHFPKEGALGWLPEISRWLAGPVILGAFTGLAVVCILVVLFIIWCFAEDPKTTIISLWK